MTRDLLFTPITLGTLDLPNRIVMAPMTRSFSPEGLPTQDVVEYYRRRAQGGVGLIVTEGTSIERPAAKNDPDVPHFYGAALPTWKRVVDAVHAEGGKIAPQLWHVGGAINRRMPEYRPARPVDSPSGVAIMDEPVGEPMSDEAIADTFAAFAAAAREAKALGFDAVELHGAHGYLVDQFFFPITNRRGDRWGGSTLRERSRFAVELVRQVRQAIGPSLPLVLRISQWKSGHFDAKMATDPKEMRQWLEPLAEAGVDVFHCSQRRFWEPEFAGSDLNFAGWARKVGGRPTITVGSVGLTGEFTNRSEVSHPASLDELLRRMERGDFDLVAVGRALIVNPDWPKIIREGRIESLRDYDVTALQTLY